MGSEVTHRYFDAEDFSRFRELLDAETDLLAEHMHNGAISPRGDVAGFELEAWLIDGQGNAWPHNKQFLDQLNNALVVPELARFNIELNGSPSTLTGRVFTRLYDELTATWADCRNTADTLNCGLATIGTLPTATPELFDSKNMSEMIRYQSLNDRVMALRNGQHLDINIEGGDGHAPLNLVHHDVMLEAAATSFQIHLQCRPDSAVRDFNASLISSAPLAAIAANSPFLFGHSLWDESRIPLFEQSVSVGPRNPPRVTFGADYVHESLLELFEENRRDHLILIPMVQDSPPERFAHLRFQNGTLWRWVRPLLGFDFDGQLHLRIEQRVPSAGPSLVDCVANAAFYYGCVCGFRLDSEPPEAALPFADTRENFYNAARYGLNARTRWQGGEVGMRAHIIDTLLPLAVRGLESLNIPSGEITEYLDIIGARADNAQNGAAWQRRWLQTNDASLNDLVLAYQEQQESARPVHTWPL